jgi:hypothetical protein
VVARRSPLAEVGDEAKEVTDGATAGAEDTSHSQQLRPREDTGGEGGGKEGEDGEGVGSYTGHRSLLPVASRVAVQPLMILPRRPSFLPQPILIPPSIRINRV